LGEKHLNIEELRKKMREKGRFSKYCSECGEVFGSDDIDEFLKDG